MSVTILRNAQVELVGVHFWKTQRFPGRTDFIFSDGNGREAFRLQVKDWSGSCPVIHDNADDFARSLPND